MNKLNASTVMPEFVWKKRLSQAKVIKVDSLVYKGYLDGIEASEFGEWMLTEGDQTVMGSQTILSLSAIYADTRIVNSVNIHKLLTDAVYTCHNATLSLAVFEKGVETTGLQIRGRLRGLKVPEDLLLSESGVIQQVPAVKHFNRSITVDGNLQADSLTELCQTLSSNNTHVIITGNAVFKEEPNVSNSVNNQTWMDLIEKIWLEEDDVAITNATQMVLAQFSELVVENINNNNVEEHLSKLLSLSQDQTINGTFFFTTVTMSGGLEAGKATVGGSIQGLEIQFFVRNVMLDGEDQEITVIHDFNHLIVDGILVTEGLVNSLNLSTDVMLNNVANNTFTAVLTMTSISAKRLMVPPGTIVAGTDVLRWNRTVVKKAGPSTMTGNIVFGGQFDSARGIRVDGLVNGMEFNKNHVMVMHTGQQITGVKTFSPRSTVAVHSIAVEGHLSHINITDFYSHQVITSDNTTIFGAKKFSSPLASSRAVLPEVYQGHNLSWLDTQLSFPLPWDQYQAQLAALEDTCREAELSISGQAFYLKNVSRIGDIEGTVLFAFPLRNLNTTALGAIRLVGKKTVLSLIHWSNEYNMFHDKPESVVYLLQHSPLDVQPVSFPGGEIAAYVTGHMPKNKSAQQVKYGEILSLRGNQIHLSKVIDGQPHSQLLSFQYGTNKTCFIVVADICRVYCPVTETQRIRLPSFHCQNVTKMSVLPTHRALYLMGLQSGSLVIWEFQDRRFVKIESEPQFNPVSVAATLNRVGNPIIAVANRHYIGNPHLETINIYRLNENTVKLSLEQQLPSISPMQVQFGALATRESVLYVASDNPATPLEVFVYRGLLGYQRLTVERTLAQPTYITTFTDLQHRHFVLCNSEQKAQILQAQFQGKQSFTNIHSLRVLQSFS